MTQISIAFDAYLNANILLVVAFGLWLVTRFLLNRVGLKYAYTTQLRLLNCVFLAILFSPVFALVFNQMASLGLLPAGFSVNLSDFMLAQYLNGSLNIPASEMEQVLALRGALKTGLLQPSGWLGQAAGALIVVGFVVFAARCWIAGLRLRRIISDSYPWRRFGNIHLRLSDRALVPFSARSVRRRYIVVPSGMLAQSQDLKIALSHEFQHLRQRDVEWEIGLEILKSIFFWNPVIYLWKHQIEHLRELSCDQQILARRRFDVQAYCDCLLRVCQTSLRRDASQMIALPRVSLVQFDRRLFGNSGLTLLRRRMDSLFEARAVLPARRTGLFLMAPLVALMALSTIAIQRPKDWSHDRLMLSSIINLERLEALNLNAR